MDAEAADGRASVSATGLKAAGAAADGRTSVSATGPKAAGAPVAGDALCAGTNGTSTGTTLVDAEADADAQVGRTLGDALCAGTGGTSTGTTLVDAEVDADAQVGRTLIGAVGPKVTPSGKARMHLEPAGKQDTRGKVCTWGGNRKAAASLDPEGRRADGPRRVKT